MKDEALAWEYSHEEEKRMARDDAIIAQWMFKEVATRVFGVQNTEISVEVIDKITREVTRYARQHREQILNDWESTQ